MARKNTRDLIIGVASALFATRGFGHTTMETIAASAGRGRRTVYMYFRDKIEIYNAVVDKEISLITRPLRDVAGDINSLDKTLKLYASVRIDGISKLLKRNPLLMRDFAQGHNRIERLREKLNNEEIRIVTTLLDDFLSRNPRHSNTEPADLAISFMNMLRGNDRLLTVGEREEKISELNKLACDIFLDGIR